MACLTLGIASCGNSNMTDLETYVKDVKARPGGKITPLPEMKTFASFQYKDTDLREPFEPITKALQNVAPTAANQLRPDTNREREVLEQFALDTLRMAGSLKQNNEKWAIVKTSDGFIYRVKVGHHIGKNFGKITRISDTQIDITEIVNDGLGGWVERQASLKIND
jgi:type IV pilus assembly protein PilP